MRTLVGVDADDLYVPSIELLGRLRFAENTATLLHVDSPVGFQVTPPPVVYEHIGRPELEERMRRIGESLLSRAQDLAGRYQIADTVETRYRLGDPAETLLRNAEELRSHLIAIGSGRTSALQSFFLGSVGRTLATRSEISFLVARNLKSVDRKVSVVFATDHSDYAERCYRRLLAMAPQGIDRLTVVTATDAKLEAQIGHRYNVRPDDSPFSDVKALMRARGEEMLAPWADRGVPSEYRLAEGHPVDVIREAMADTDAELLILGAAGHSALERFFIGSLALHAVAAEPYSVLVLRMPREIA